MIELFACSIRELFKMTIVGFGLIAIIDYGWAYYTKARYFLLHGIWNMIMVIIMLPDFIYTLIDPLNAVAPNQDVNRWPMIFGTVLHIWHCVAYNDLTVDDYFHHGVFGLGLFFVGLIWDWGYSMNFLLFFICGLPGGIDYLMLAGVKHDYISKMTEKRFNKALNVWLRGPGCIASACIVWANWVNNNTSQIPTIVKLLAMILSVANGQYYARRVVASWAIHEMRDNTNT
jgi:hypothetical protein